MMERWVAVSIAAIASAVASGGVAVAVSYRLWGADVSVLREREATAEAAITMLDKSRIKTDDNIIALIDTFKEAQSKLAAAVAARSAKAAPQWYCSLFFDGPDKGYLDGACQPSKDDCARVQVEQLSMGKVAGTCVGEPTAFCFSSGGTDGCYPSAQSCERHRQTIADKHVAVSQCEAK